MAGTGIVAGTDIVGVKKIARQAEFANNRKFMFRMFPQTLNSDTIAIRLTSAYAETRSATVSIEIPTNAHSRGI